jgi:hypothetical protein
MQFHIYDLKPKKTGFPCPVCAYALDSPAADFTICPSCGVEFGYSDAGTTYQVLRKEWIQFGAQWSSPVVAPPSNWNQWSQLIEGGFAYDIPWLNGCVTEYQVGQVPMACVISDLANRGSLITR